MHSARTQRWFACLLCALFVPALTFAQQPINLEDPFAPHDPVFPDGSGIRIRAADKEDVEPPQDGKEVVAVVEGRFISQRDVELSWRTAYRHISELAERRGMTSSERIERLTKEWKAAVQRFMQDTLLYREATRERDRIIDKLVRASMATSGRNTSAVMAREEIEERYREIENKLFARYREQALEEAGGEDELVAMLKETGQTRAEWEEALREKAIIRSFLHQRVGEVIVSPKQVRAYYGKHREHFTTKEQVKFREILLRRERMNSDESYRQAIELVGAAVKAGERTFEQLARDISQSSSRARGGLFTFAGQEFVERGVHHDAVDTALAELKPGETAGPIRTKYGVYFVQLVERRESKVQSLADAHKQIENEIYEQSLRARRQEILDQLREDARVDIRNDDLPAKYRRASATESSLPN